MADLADWTARPYPKREEMVGRFVRLEPLIAAQHGDGLFAASSVKDAKQRFRWLPEEPPETRESFDLWLARAETSADPLFFAVIDKATGRVEGRQTLMRIDAGNGVAEIGNIYWGPAIARTPATTEAFYLFGRYLFDELGYRRYEWKCDNANEPSKRAAERFGMKHEGLFRQHKVIKAKNRDTAWFSIIDGEWQDLRSALKEWLAPENFDETGRQRRKLADIRKAITGARD